MPHYSSQFAGSHPAHSFNDLIEEWRPTLGRLARKIMPTRCKATEDDLTQAGVNALYRAQRGYNSERGATFKTYATHAIKHAMRRELRRVQGKIPFETIDNWETHACPIASTSLLVQTKLAVRECIASLPTNSLLADIYEYLYVFGLSHRQIAVRLSLSRPRVKTLHNQLIQSARRQIGSIKS